MKVQLSWCRWMSSCSLLDFNSLWWWRGDRSVGLLWIHTVAIPMMIMIMILSDSHLLSQAIVWAYQLMDSSLTWLSKSNTSSNHENSYIKSDTTLHCTRWLWISHEDMIWVLCLIPFTEWWTTSLWYDIIWWWGYWSTHQSLFHIVYHHLSEECPLHPSTTIAMMDDIKISLLDYCSSYLTQCWTQYHGGR